MLPTAKRIQDSPKLQLLLENIALRRDSLILEPIPASLFFWYSLFPRHPLYLACSLETTKKKKKKAETLLVSAESLHLGTVLSISVIKHLCRISCVCHTHCAQEQRYQKTNKTGTKAACVGKHDFRQSHAFQVGTNR